MVFEELRRPIPVGLDLDHLCRVRSCVNPDHLEPVTRAENLRRGSRGKVNQATIQLMRTLDATTNLNRLDIAELLGISGWLVARYLGSQGRGRNRRLRLRGQPFGEWQLSPSGRGNYPLV